MGKSNEFWHKQIVMGMLLLIGVLLQSCSHIGLLQHQGSTPKKYLSENLEGEIDHYKLKKALTRGSFDGISELNYYYHWQATYLSGAYYQSEKKILAKNSLPELQRKIASEHKVKRGKTCFEISLNALEIDMATYDQWSFMVEDAKGKMHKAQVTKFGSIPIVDLYQEMPYRNSGEACVAYVIKDFDRFKLHISPNFNGDDYEKITLTWN